MSVHNLWLSALFIIQVMLEKSFSDLPHVTIQATQLQPQWEMSAITAAKSLNQLPVRTSIGGWNSKRGPLHSLPFRSRKVQGKKAVLISFGAAPVPKMDTAFVEPGKLSWKEPLNGYLVIPPEIGTHRKCVQLPMESASIFLAYPQKTALNTALAIITGLSKISNSLLTKVQNYGGSKT